MKPRPNGKLLKPKANYTFTPQEAKAFCWWSNELGMPYGYSSNLERCAKAKTGKLHGMESHVCHVHGMIASSCIHFTFPTCA